jgi:hypothetical protein
MADSEVVKLQAQLVKLQGALTETTKERDASSKGPSRERVPGLIARTDSAHSFPFRPHVADSMGDIVEW